MLLIECYKLLLLKQNERRLSVYCGFFTFQWHADAVFIDDSIAPCHAVFAFRYSDGLGFLVGVEYDNDVSPGVYAFKIFKPKGDDASFFLLLLGCLGICRFGVSSRTNGW